MIGKKIIYLHVKVIITVYRFTLHEKTYHFKNCIISFVVSEKGSIDWQYAL